jgi:hypothetical protein
MKALNYRQILKARGYKAVEQTKYQGQNIFIKQHKYNSVYCIIMKDTHGKAQTMTFNILNNTFPGNMVEFKEAEFDRDYLEREANTIHTAFEELKTKKAPKYIYCF